jgi:hypothetical protein
VPDPIPGTGLTLGPRSTSQARADRRKFDSLPSIRNLPDDAGGEARGRPRSHGMNASFQSAAAGTAPDALTYS